jgi:hypothetical protein
LYFPSGYARVYETEYNKGNDEEEYILFDAKRGSGWCKLL